MEFKYKDIKTKSIKVSLEENGQEIGRASLCMGYNDLHEEPFGILEDVYVHEDFRSQGLGKKLVNEVIAKAKEEKCYKLVAFSRHRRPIVHELYKKLGFDDYGREFRINL